MTMRAEGSADENTAGICVGRVSVVRIAIGVRIIRRRRIVTLGTREGDTNPDEHSCLGRNRRQGDRRKAHPCDKNHGETV